MRLAVREVITPTNRRRVLIIVAVILLVLHGVAHEFVAALGPIVLRHGAVVTPDMIILSVMLLSLFMMLVAQAMEAVTRAFYVRGDLELILSSPASSRRVFAVRMVATTIASLTLIATLVLPIIDMLALHQGVGWLGAYGVLAAFAALAQALALGLTSILFGWIGPRRTRLVAQVVGALLGAAVVIGLQVPGILATGSYNRLATIADPISLARVPAASSILWWPARAAAGDFLPLVAVVAIAFALFALTVVVYSRTFAARVVAAAGISERPSERVNRRGFVASRGPLAALRAKELRLIARDPWLVSQSLLQVLYLIPPALLLWKNFGSQTGTLAILVPVLVMTAAQLAGGLAWLAISAEDAPDLIATAPLTRALAIRAKIEAVILGVGIVVGPILALLAIVALKLALIGLGFALAAIGTSTIIQYRFRSRSRRSQFRRRQRSSQIATFAETVAAISWAGTSGLAAAGSPILIIPLFVALLIVLLCLPGLWAANTR
jgi:ABC-2 type transport system permease protein